MGIAIASHNPPSNERVRCAPNQTTRKQPVSRQATMPAEAQRQNGQWRAPARWHLMGLDMKAAASSEVALPRWRLGIEELRNSGDKLRWRERFGQENAVRNTVCGPVVGTCGGHIDDGECRVDLSGQLRYFPSIHLALPEINVRYECAAFGLAFLQERHRLFARRGDSQPKTAIGKSGLHDAQNRRVVVHNQDNK